MAGHQHGAIVPSSSSHRMNSYHVFLSFRGEDTRKTFTDHIYTALVNAGFRTFRDDDGIERGEDVTSELHNAIRQSRSSIIVFSKGYASSRWCLDELCLILERRRTAKHIVLPIFYDVDPSDVRRQRGSYAKAFEKHERRYSKAEVKKWRDALGQAADLSGMVLKNQEDGHESKFIEKIIKVMEDKLHQPFAVPSPYLVGIDSTVRSLNQWLRDGSNSVRIAALCGMGGIGKTAIAKFVYNMNLRHFDGGSFLEEIRDASKRSDGLVHLQKKLLSDILKGKDARIWTTDDGILKIQDALSSKRIFVVLDDVDHIDQMNAIFGMRNWLNPGSRIIITTRHAHLLRTNEAYTVRMTDGPFQDHAFCKVYNVKELNHDSSCRLFSLYAFGQDYPFEEYATEAMRIVNYCGGLPLALKVLGSSLRGQSSIDIWRSTADKLQAIPNQQVMEKLKISFDSLQDDHDRNLFLHIACFFIGKDKDRAVKILDECEFYTIVGIENLIERCVLSVDDQNKKLRMHQLLRDMGREIIRLESPKDPGKRSRLWHHKDSFRVLSEKIGTRTIEGLILDMHMFKENHSTIEKKFENTETPTVPRHESDYLNAYHDTPGDPGESTMKFEIDTFIEMHQLMILHLKHVQLTGNYEKFPKTLRWLSWKGFPHVSIPNILHLQDVVSLDMPYSNLKQVLTQPKFLGSLRILDLRHSYGLVDAPDFSLLKNLERLVLKYCTSLLEIHESIGCLQKLVELNLKKCENLKKLPKNFTVLKSLETLDISGCISIKYLPDLSKLDSLKILLADGLAISKLFSASSPKDVDSQEADISLEIMDPRLNLEISWASCLPSSLLNLSLANCNLSDGDFPWNLSHLSSLQKLDLSGNVFSSMPDFIRHLSLDNLNLESCRNLEYLEGLPRPKQLDIASCMSLKKITYKRTENNASVGLSYIGCDSLVDVEDEFKLEPLDNFSFELIEALGLGNLEIPKDLQVKIACGFWSSCSILPIQGLFENGTFNVFIPGEEVPRWFPCIYEGNAVFLDLPSIPNIRVRGLTICGVYYFLNWEWSPDAPIPLALQVVNIRKKLSLSVYPSCCGIPQDDEHMMWFCSIYFKQSEQFEEGDEIYVRFVTDDDDFQIKEYGVDFLLEKVSFSAPSERIESSHSFSYVADSSEPWYSVGVYLKPDQENLEFEEDTDGYGDGKVSSSNDTTSAKDLIDNGYLEMEENTDSLPNGVKDVDLDNNRLNDGDVPKQEADNCRGLLHKVVMIGILGILSFAFVSRVSFPLIRNKQRKDSK